jgi:hypothetical protein
LEVLPIRFNLFEEVYSPEQGFAYQSLDSSTSYIRDDKTYLIKPFNQYEDDYDDNIPSETKKIFTDYLKYPENALKYKIEGRVDVIFSYNEEGYIKVKSANSNNKDLKIYIINTLGTIRLKNGIVEVEKEFFARFYFKLQ